MALHGESHLSVWWKGINLTNLCIWLDILSLPPVAPIFPFQTWSHHERIHLTMQLKRYVHWCCTARAVKFEICWNTKSFYATAGAAKYEDKSLCFPFKLILLSIFYSLSLYHSTNVIMLLDSFFHVPEMLKPTDVIRLELQSLEVAEMLSPLMLRLELQNMKISHYILSSNLYY